MTLRIRDLEVPVTSVPQNSLLPEAAAQYLGIPKENIRSLTIQKKSLDARRKARIVYHYQVDLDIADEEVVFKNNTSRVDLAPSEGSSNPVAGLDLGGVKLRHPPVIIGTGPAGTFAALTLAKAGQPCILVERGESVEERLRSVNRLRLRGTLNTESNYCFGEGGAGTFSDGKLTCGKSHPLIKHVFEEFVAHGAPAEILYEAKPHIGTDYLLRIAINMRRYLQTQGSTFHFKSRFTDFTSGGDTAKYLVHLDNGAVIPTDHLVLAIGHSARETYQLLLDKGLAIVPKPFAMGVRIEHPQDKINKIQFGSCDLLPAAEYKLVSHAGERGIWTFCMCPGGHLLPTSAQEGHLAINGMSYHARKSGFANAAVVVNVLREDYFQGHALDGMRFQQKLEQDAFQAGGGGYKTPAQRLTDFLAQRDSKGIIESTYKPGVTNARLDRILPTFIVDALKSAVGEYNQKMRGYICGEAIIAGVESKTSSPISMMRTKEFESVSHPGIFPTGEGAGFAGGIVSAALDGVRVGRAVLENALGQNLRPTLH